MVPGTEAPLIALVLAFSAVVLATIQDLKTREVPDSLNSGLIVLGFALAALRWAFGEGWEVIVNTTLGFGFGYGFGALLYYARQWGGGDAKLLAGLGALLGMFSTHEVFVVGYSTTGLVIAASVVAVSGVIAYLTRHEGRSSVVSTILGGVFVAGVSLSVGAVSVGVAELFLPGYLLWIFICGAVWGVAVLLYLAYKNRGLVTFTGSERVLIYAGLLFGMGIVGGVVVFDVIVPGLVVVLGALVALSPLVLVISRRLEGVLFRREVDPSGLVLGDWLAEDIVVDGVVIIATSNPGLSERQIDELRDLWNRKVFSRIVIKDGIAFVPAFLFALIVIVL